MYGVLDVTGHYKHYLRNSKPAVLSSVELVYIGYVEH